MEDAQPPPDPDHATHDPAKSEPGRRSSLRLGDAESVAATRRDMFGDGSLLDTLSGAAPRPDEDSADAGPSQPAQAGDAAAADGIPAATPAPPDLAVSLDDIIDSFPAEQDSSVPAPHAAIEPPAQDQSTAFTDHAPVSDIFRDLGSAESHAEPAASDTGGPGLSDGEAAQWPEQQDGPPAEAEGWPPHPEELHRAATPQYAPLPEPASWPPFPVPPGTEPEAASDGPAPLPPYLELPATSSDVPPEPAAPPFPEPAGWPPFPTPPGVEAEAGSDAASPLPPYIELPAGGSAEPLEPAPPSSPASFDDLRFPSPDRDASAFPDPSPPHYADRREIPVFSAAEPPPSWSRFEDAQAPEEATARIAAEANATAEALENLKRLLSHSTPDATPRPEERPHSPLDINLHGDLGAFHVSEPPMLPLPMPPPEESRGKGVYLLGFVTGLGLSLMAGLALYFLINIG